MTGVDASAMDERLRQHRLRPEMSMLDWRGLLLHLHRTDQQEVARLLLEALAEDDASPNIPADLFGYLLAT